MTRTSWPHAPVRWSVPMELMEEAALSREEVLRYAIHSFFIERLRDSGADPRVLLDEYRWTAEYDFLFHALIIKGDDLKIAS